MIHPRIRSPIIVNLGHVDAGKTTLLDTIRDSAVAEKEPGLITQHICPYYIPSAALRGKIGALLETLKIDLTIPGLLWIDSPGHEAFTTLRKRGGAIADIAVLIVDIFEGFQPQTDESLTFLRQFKTPFVVALTKVDRIPGWIPTTGGEFLSSFQKQPERVQEELDERLYTVVGQLSSRGFPADRFDRVENYAKQIALVPVSGLTGEGVQNLLAIIAGLAQKYLHKGLEVQEGEGKGTVLEVKERRGLGLTADVVLYDGCMAVGDLLVIGSAETRKGMVTKIKALFSISEKGSFAATDHVSAAACVTVSAPNLSLASAGSPLRIVQQERDVQRAQQEIETEVAEVEIHSDGAGALLKADTLGSLEALTKTLREKGVPVRRAGVGPVTKADVADVSTQTEPVIFAFTVPVPADIESMAQDNNVRLFSSNIMYTLLQQYEQWKKDKKTYEEDDILKKAMHPGKIRVLPGFVFRQSKPAVFGVEVLAGTVKSGSRLLRDGREVGEVKEIQKSGKNIHECAKGDKVAISMPGIVFDRHVHPNDELTVLLTRGTLQMLQKVRHRLKPDEQELLDAA